MYTKESLILSLYDKKHKIVNFQTCKTFENEKTVIIGGNHFLWNGVMNFQKDSGSILVSRPFPFDDQKFMTLLRSYNVGKTCRSNPKHMH